MDDQYSGESDESYYESEEEETETEGDQEALPSGSSSSLSNYQMDDEMKGFYRHENIDPARSSMASQSMTSQHFGKGSSFNPAAYANVISSVPN